MRGSFASRPARRLSLERRIAGRPSSPCRDEHQMFVARPEDSRLGQKKGKSSTLPNFPEGSRGTGPIRLPRRRWLRHRDRRCPPPRRHLPDLRSEEHTSELQSLMRISYAVFCLKKKKKYRIEHTAKVTLRI